MPPKRRIRNGITPTSSSLHTLKSNVAAANAILQNNSASTTNNNNYPTTISNNSLHHNNALNIGGGIGSGDGLTTKQKQQLDRNNYLSTLTKDQLKVECRKRGQKVTGTKIELVDTFFRQFIFLCFFFFFINSC